MKILVTGRNGFIGSHLVKRLTEQGNEVVGEGALIEGIAQVYHLAGVSGSKELVNDPFVTLKANFDTMENVIASFMDKPVKILFTSTAEVAAGIPYHILGLPTREETIIGWADPFNPRWAYSFSKFASEMLLVDAGQSAKFTYSIARLSNVYGPGMSHDYVVKSFIKRILAGEDPFIVKSPEDTRCFCYVDDIVEGLIQIMNSKEADGQIFNLGSNVETSIGELAEILKEISGKDFKIQFKLSTLPIERRQPRLDKIRTLLGWDFKVDLKEGLQRTYKWYEEQVYG